MIDRSEITSPIYHGRTRAHMKALQSKRYKPNGRRECERRMQQIVKGGARLNPSHPFYRQPVLTAGAALRRENGYDDRFVTTLHVNAAQNMHLNIDDVLKPLGERYSSGKET